VTATAEREARHALIRAPSQGKHRRWLPWLTLALGLVLFVYGERTIPAAQASQWGLLAVASPAYGVSILLVTVGFVAAVRQSNFRAAVAAIALMLVVLRLPTSIATDMPMYSWTYKHLGVVDYIQHAHSLARDADIYNAWPGTFALTAWFADLTGVPPVSIAHWFTPVFHALFTWASYGVASAWGLKPMQKVTAAFLVMTLNWVLQDYFSPQATTVFLAAGILALVGLSQDRPIGAWLILIIFAAAAITHQLTPYWLLALIGILVVSRRMKPWWIVFPMAAILAGMLAYNWETVSQYSLFSDSIARNVTGNIPTVGTMGQRVTSVLVRTLSASMWVSTALVLLYRWRKKQPFWRLGVLSLSPMLILAGQDYGGEAVFRVFLYSLIGCCIVLAPVIVTALQAGGWRFRAAAAAVLVATGLAAQGATGGWYANVMPKVQVETATAVLSQAELPSYLTAIAPVWPERTTWRYVNFAKFSRNYDALMIQATELARLHFDTPQDYSRLTRRLAGRGDASTYLIMTDQMRIYAWYYGILPWDAFPNLKKRLYNDPTRWEPFYDGQGITVFLHRVTPVNAPDIESAPTGLGNAASQNIG
jgi:hypothetical protein